MPENKTQPTTQPVAGYLAKITDPQRRADCELLIRLMQEATGCAAVMWGPGIVGFGQYHYRYDSGREGDMCIAGFSSRKTDISIYLFLAEEVQARLLPQLGRHKMGKACLSVRRLSDISLPLLQQLITESVSAVRQRYPGG